MLPYGTLKSKELGKKPALTIEFPQNICYDVLIRTKQNRNNVHLNIL
jgi:hypothetical protein